MTVGIVGLGLIGGSLAKAYQASRADASWPRTPTAAILDFAMLSGIGRRRHLTARPCPTAT